MTKSAYDELVERCVAMLYECFGADSEDPAYVRAILTEVARTLGNVTSEMCDAYEGNGRPSLEFRAMLRASPLFPPDKSRRDDH